MGARRAAGTRTADSPHALPFVKWAGGKRSMLPKLLSRLPSKFVDYYEPFIGGGALYWALMNQYPPNAATYRIQNALISDTNRHLVRTYRAIAVDVEGVITRLKIMPYESDFFYATRALDMTDASDVEIAAWFIYLNKSCFNGLYRVNKAGNPNTPFGKYKNPTICDEDNLRACAHVLKQTRTRIQEQPFEAVRNEAKAGDLVYFDPPYLPVSATSDFTAYTADGFGYEDHVRLRDLALELKERGVYVMISNSDSPVTRELYAAKPGFYVDTVSSPRAINSKGGKRGNVSELIIR